MFTNQIKLSTLFLLMFLSTTLFAQNNVDFNGYISNLESGTFSLVKDNWLHENLSHNRLNFNWYPNDKFTFSMGIRNRLIFGDRVKSDPSYSNTASRDQGLLDVSSNPLEGDSYFLNTSIDRFYLKYYYLNLEASLGRQRINWGRNLVWNPNDLFNVYSFFDVDYVEKPGADALRIQYYLNFASSIDLAISANRIGEVTAAGLLKINSVGYDFQILGGVVNEQDAVVGFGWEGSLSGVVGFRGEVSYFEPIKNQNVIESKFVGSLSFDYSFENQLSVRFETLYSQMSEEEKNIGLAGYMTQNLSARNMAFTETSLFFQLMKPITPIFNASMNFMFYPDLDGYFLNPSIDYSLSDKLSVTLLGQFFNLNINSVNEKFNMLMFRLKYDF